MRFNRELYKEAFKQGYKAAKRLNEDRKDLFYGDRDSGREEQVYRIWDQMIMVLCKNNGGEDIVEEEFYGRDEDGDMKLDFDAVRNFVFDYYKDKSFEECYYDCEDAYDEAINDDETYTWYVKPDAWEWFKRVKPILCKKLANSLTGRDN